MERYFQNTDTGTLIFVGLFAHLIIFTFTNIWFRKDLAEWTKKQPITHVTLFILSNLWPLTWLAYLVYSLCAYCGAVIQQQRLQDLVNENNELLTENNKLRIELESLRVHQESHRKRLPPYTPDVWKAILELERRLNGTESYIKHRDHLDELY